jgi:predicted PurR-regulated permease PerM
LAYSKESSSSSKSLVLIAFVLAIAALYLGRLVFIPLALAVVFSFLLTPAVILLERIHFRRVPAVIVVLALSFGVVGVVGWGVAGQLVQIMVQFPDYKENLDAKIQALHPSKDGSLSKATATVHELNKELAAVPEELSSGKKTEPGRPAHSIPVQVAPPPSSLFQDLRALLGPLAAPLETAAIVIIFTLFMLVRREDLRNRAIRLAGRGQLTVMTQALDDAGRRLSRYLILQFLVNGGYGLLFGMALYLIGVPHALLWGVLASLLRFVPYVGALVAAALPTTMALAVYPGWHHAGLSFMAFVAIEVVVSNFVEPLLYGAHTGISSLAILVAAVFWATLWGPVGLILSTPLTVCLMVVGRYVPQLGFLEILLGDEPVLTTEQRLYQRLLAMDPDEARTIAEAHLKDHSLENLYESVLIPALKIAERNVDDLDDERRAFMLQGMRELIDDLGDRLGEDIALASSVSDSPRAHLDARSPGRIACIPARRGPDELVAAMLVQLLNHAGYPAREIKVASIDGVLAEVAHDVPAIVCLSALPPFSLHYVRSLCRMLQAANPTLKIIAGFWNLEGGIDRAQERLGPGFSALVATTLSDALLKIRQLATDKKLAESAEHHSMSSV